MDKLSLFYVVCSSNVEAKKIATILLNQKLIACANIIPGMESVYYWENKIETSKECVLILKSTSDKFKKIEAVIFEKHSYDCPCIIEIPSGSVNTDYLSWALNKLV